MTLHRIGHTLSTAWACALLLAASAGDVAADPTVTCGDSYSGRGELAADCSGDITIRDGSLNLRGFTVRGRLLCDGTFCEVYSDPPEGAIRGEGDWESAGITAPGGSVTVEGINVTGFGTGIEAATVSASNSVVAGNAGNGIDGVYRIETTSSVVTLNGNDGLHSRIGSVSVTDSEITANQGSGIRALKGVVSTNSAIFGSGEDGIRNFSGLVLVEDSTISGNGGHGVRNDDADCVPTGQLELRNSAIEGNALDPACGETRACADVVSCALARVSDSSACGTSYRIQSGLPGESWRVCALD